MVRIVIPDAHERRTLASVLTLAGEVDVSGDVVTVTIPSKIAGLTETARRQRRLA